MGPLVSEATTLPAVPQPLPLLHFNNFTLCYINSNVETFVNLIGCRHGAWRKGKNVVKYLKNLKSILGRTNKIKSFG